MFIVCVISADRYDAAALTVYFFYPAVMIALGELPLWAVLRRTLPALPFVFFAGVSNIVFEPTLAPVGVSYGVLSCVVLVEKALLSIGGGDSDSDDALNELLAQLGGCMCRASLPTTVMLCFRYLTLLASEAQHMARAYHLFVSSAKGAGDAASRRVYRPTAAAQYRPRGARLCRDAMPQVRRHLP